MCLIYMNIYLDILRVSVVELARVSQANTL